MSTSKKKHPLMPKAGTRARLVLVTLAGFPGPVEESVLMDAHGMDSRAPTIWRQGPYLLLTTSALIDRLHDGRWYVTARGRELLAELETDQERVEAAPLPAANMATPRSAPDWRPLAAKSWRASVVREGAFDYAEIPSLHARYKNDLAVQS